MGMRVVVGWVAMVALAGVAGANPGDLPDIVHSDAPPLTILDPAAATQCPQKPGICINAGARSTISVASAPMAAAAGTADKQSKAAIVVPRFSRAASVAASEGSQTATTPADDAPWTLEVTGTLKRAAWAGNALFLFFDLEDPESIENRQFTALFQAPVKAGPKLAARVSLSPEDGFRPGHTYRVRIVQLINGKEIVLGESDVSLL
jgi:phage terminase large subunit-like protein